jgi:hypothetical protein
MPEAPNVGIFSPDLEAQSFQRAREQKIKTSQDGLNFD